MLLFSFAGLLLIAQGSGHSKSAEIREQLDVVLSTDDDEQQAAAAKSFFAKYGLPDTATVGDEPAYEFVVLTCSSGDSKLHNAVLRRALLAAKQGKIPADAAVYCAAHVRQEALKTASKKHGPADPALRDQIEQLFQADQEARQKENFDMAKMDKVDREHAAALQEIFARHGVPTWKLVGPQAASDFVTMIQHQPAPFRRSVLPLLKANVDAGQADPGSYAMVFDRLQTDSGKKQLYGENLVCDSEHPELHLGPIEDEQHVDERRAAAGLMRLDLYAKLVVAMTPDVCPKPR